MQVSILLTFSLLAATSAGAQEIAGGNPGIAVRPDTGTALEGSRAGKAAAEQRKVYGRAAVGFLGGLPVGFAAPALVGGSPIGIIGGVLGIGIIGGAASRLGSTAPPDSLPGARGEAYKRAFSSSYEERLLARRKKAARLGAVAGGLSGFALLFLLLSQSGT